MLTIYWTNHALYSTVTVQGVYDEPGVAGHYYKMAGSEELAQFLASPESFVAPQAPRELPPPELLPERVTSADVKAAFPAPIELQGYCPVTYLDGKCR